MGVKNALLGRKDGWDERAPQKPALTIPWLRTDAEKRAWREYKLWKYAAKLGYQRPVSWDVEEHVEGGRGDRTIRVTKIILRD